MRDALGPLLPTLVDERGGEVREVRHLPDHPTDLLAAAVHDESSTLWPAAPDTRSYWPDWDPDVGVVGLPGNPFAALVAAYTLLAPLLAGLSGRPLPQAPVTGPVRPAAGLTRLIPVAWEGGVARVISGHRAAFLRGATLADALATITPSWVDGTPVPLLLIR